jgi:hypothetical protein
LLDLPDHCLLAVLRCCADDPHSLFSAARAHSRLRQAAVLASNSIKAAVKQQQFSSVLQYISTYGRHIVSIDLKAYKPLCSMHHVIMLQELPHNQLRGLSSLRLNRLLLQLQPGCGFQGALGAPITSLQLERCVLLDGEQGLAAALPLLPKLQHLSLIGIVTRSGSPVGFPSSAMQSLQQLTYLETTGPWSPEPHGVQHLQGLTRLQDLRLHGLHTVLGKHSIQASVMAGLRQLTHLKVEGYKNSCVFEPGMLEGKSLLQHLAVVDCSIAGGSAGVEQLLWYMPQLEHLTYINFRSSLRLEGSSPPASAYTALTASSKLQHLNIRFCTLPDHVWQHLFPVNGLTSLPQLQELHIGAIRNPAGPAAAPEISRLVSCYPGLQVLTMPNLQYSAERLAPLTGLTGLTRLDLIPVAGSTEGLEVVCQLTGLRQLHLTDPRGDEGLLLQLTQLKQLTKLQYCWETFVQVSTQVQLSSQPTTINDSQ